MANTLAPGQLGMEVTMEDGSKKIIPLKRSTICLTMIVKNESHIIERCFNSIKDYIDYWVITDTGSTDNTPKIIESYFKKHNIKGELHHVPWQNFGYNRSKVMELSRNKADYCILMDADFTFKCMDPDFKRKLYYDAYLVSYVGNLDYCQVLFVKSCYKWEYIGVTHEYIKCTDPAPKEKILTAKMPFFTFEHVGDGGCKSDKYERDVRLLVQGLKDEPDNVRYHFYLAQSYKDLRQWDLAIEWYQKRVDLGGWPEEVYYAMLQVAYCMFMAQKPFSQFSGYLLEAYNFRPIRMEALYLFVAFCRNAKKYLLGYSMGRPACDNPYPERDVLFIDRGIHEFRMVEEVSICAFFLGKYLDCLVLNKQLLKVANNQPPEFKQKVEMRIELCNQKLAQLQERNITNADIHATVVQHALHEKDRMEEALKKNPQGLTGVQAEMLEQSRAALANTNSKLENSQTNVTKNVTNNVAGVMTKEQSQMSITDSTQQIHQQQQQIQQIQQQQQNQLGSGIQQQRQVRLELDKTQLEIMEMNREKVRNVIPGMQKILVLGNFIAFNLNHGIDNNRIKFFHYIAKQSNNVIIQGITQEDFFHQGVNTHALIEKIYGVGNKPDLIVYYLMGTTDLQMKFLYGGFDTIDVKKVAWIEDIQYIQYYQGFIKQLNFSGVLLSYKNSQIMDLYKQVLGDEIMIADMEQSIDTEVFKIDRKGEGESMKKEYDILFYGYHDPKIYQFRHRLYNLLKENVNKFNIKFIEHPGYNNVRTITNSKENVVGEELAELINKSYLVVCTRSNYDILLKKYLEAGCAGSIICGDLPPDYKDWLNKIYMVHINDEMTDGEIIKKMESELENKAALERNVKVNMGFFNKIASYQTGYEVLMEKLNKMIGTSVNGAYSDKRIDAKEIDAKEEVIKEDVDKIKVERNDIGMGKKKQLFIELFKSSNADRQKEYYTVLEKNINNSEIEMINIFVDNIEFYIELETKYNGNNKLRFIKIDNRLTFKKCLEYIKNNVENDVICIISNADIYYDDTLKRLDSMDMNNLVVSLLRYDVAADGSNRLHNNNGNAGITCDSQDCWILKTPIRVPENCDFTFGLLGCDNRITFEFYEAGYNLINCPMDIKSYHLHLVNHKTYDKSSTVKGNYLLLDVVNLDKVRGDYDKYYKMILVNKNDINKVKSKHLQNKLNAKI